MLGMSSFAVTLAVISVSGTGTRARLQMLTSISFARKQPSQSRSRHLCRQSGSTSVQEALPSQKLTQAGHRLSVSYKL